MVKSIKKKFTRFILILFSIIVLPFVAIFVYTLIKTWVTPENNSEKEDEQIQEEPKAGDTLSGTSHKEIVSEFKKQKQLSDADTENYMKSLSGKKIIWIGLSMNVRADWVNGQQYMVISFTEKLFDTNLAYANVENNPEYQKIPDMTLIKVSGSIDRVEKYLESGINVYFEDAIIEVIE